MEIAIVLDNVYLAKIIGLYAMLRLWLILILSFLGWLPTLSVFAAVPSQEDLEYFEQHVRPLLVAHCYECHGVKKQFAELRLDSRDHILRGGDSGPAIVPSKPEESLLIEAVRRESFEMPPEEELAEDQIAVLVEWIQRGAVWPDEVNQEELDRQREIDEHWAFQPIQNPPLPEVQQADWPRNDIDHFILARLEQQGLSPSPAANERTLLRRLVWDLTGLPVTLEQVEEFQTNDGELKTVKVVEQLLASPHYGERWARYWLDVARYADTKGYVFFEKKPFEWAYTYRDYVIESFNRDKPFDQFVREQLAADLLPKSGTDRSSLAALGYITVGARFKNSIPDILDDRIDVVTRGLMGLTVTCARCHDHKYDPVSTEDYYSLYGIFANSIEPVHQPFLHEQEFTEEEKEKSREIKKLAEQFETSRHERYLLMIEGSRNRLAECLRAAQARRGGPETEKFDVIVDGDDLFPRMIHHWQQYLTDTERAKSPVFSVWHQLAKIPQGQFQEQVTSTLQSLVEQADTNPLVLQALAESELTSFGDVVECYATLLLAVDLEWKQLLEKSQTSQLPAPTRLTPPAKEELRQVLQGADSPMRIPFSQFSNLHLYPDRKSQEKLKSLYDILHQAKAKAPEKLAQAMVLNDAPNLVEARVFKRGNPAQPGQQVPRRFLRHLSYVSDEIYNGESGRRQLAEAIVSPKNPLTARVIVNRVWQHHFGRGLVATPSNFGLQGVRPTHPELLDHLATWFMQHGWSMKALHRYILDSASYRQQSISRQECESIDPENHLCWKMNRRRQDLESMRDALLATAGLLDLTVGGPSVKNGMNAEANRRTLYSHLDREDFPGIFRMFDFPNPDVSSGARNKTSVPGQTLFLMNHPLVFSCAKSIARSIEKNGAGELVVRELFERILHREPEPEELEDAVFFIQNAATYPEQDKSWAYGYGEFDEEKQQLASFQELPYWTGKQWQGGTTWPDSKIGWVALNSRGGHPGNDIKHVAVARWTAPQTMTINCEALLAHHKTEGNGVRGRIVVKNKIQYGPWEVHNDKLETNVAQIECREGDTIDFIVDVNGNLGYDSYEWDPTLVATAPLPELVGRRWNYQETFGDQVVMLSTPLQRLAQILLLTNEFQFID